MLPDRVSNTGPLAYESGALPIALRGPSTIKAVNRLTAYINQEQHIIQRSIEFDLISDFF